jgi:hypothetical protein
LRRKTNDDGAKKSTSNKEVCSEEEKTLLGLMKKELSII